MTGRLGAALRRYTGLERPLDWVRSIKVKLGVLVVASVALSLTVAWFGLLQLDLRLRYSLPVAMAVALLVTQILARGMTSPLRELTAAARAMAAGDYSRRVRATSRDEVGEAARAFNRMAEDLAAVDRQRRELVANVSHEVRTPVAALRAMLENMVDGVTPADSASLRTALEQTERLSRLVTELLDLSRVDAGVVPLHPGDVDVARLLGAVVAEARTAGRDVRYTVAVQPEGLTAWADEGRLRQLMTNLVDNAARHTPTGGLVQVTANQAPDGSVQFDVADQGPGIAPQDRGRVFERFSRGGTAAPGDGGTGLGLAIAQWVVGLHGGSIRILDDSDSDAGNSDAGDSNSAEAAGPGCRIRVHLPGRPAPP